jgi:hypothetical protein
MADEPGLHALLVRAADDVGDVAPPSPVDLLRRAQRRSAAVFAPLAAVIVVSLVVALAVALHDRASRTADAAGVGVAALKHYRWRLMPPAPIQDRSGAAAVWTGHEFLVWGGTVRRDVDDGAAYDPASRTWRRLAPSPLSPRRQPAYAWTGHDLFVWGGMAGRTVRTDGALYDPANDTWKTIPAAPMSSAAGPAAFALGSKVVLLTQPRLNAGRIDASEYDPASNTWARLPSVPKSPGHDIASFVGVSAGNTLLVWSEWEHITQAGGTSGTDAYRFVARSSGWSRSVVRARSGYSMSGALLAGSHVLVPVQNVWCGGCLGSPGLPHVTGTSYDASTGERTPIASSPLRDYGASYVWTGRALIGIGDYSKHRSTVWNPADNTWTRLSNAPYAAFGGAAVWTGKSLIVWGQLRGWRTHKRVAVTGMEFAPPGG